MAANDPALQLALPFGPLPMAAVRLPGTRPAPVLSAEAMADPCGLHVAGSGGPARPARRIEPLSPAPALGRLRGQGPVSMRAAIPAGVCAPVLKVDPGDARRTVLIGRLGAVCDELDRLVAAEEAQDQRGAARPS